jgi:hypothetical protein
MYGSGDRCCLFLSPDKRNYDINSATVGLTQGEQDVCRDPANSQPAILQGSPEQSPKQSPYELIDVCEHW